MRYLPLPLFGLVLVFLTACNGNGGFDGPVTIPEFTFAKTLTFEPKLSAYQLFKGEPAALEPAEDVHLLELSSILFTDYAHKQRLLKLPTGTQMTRLADGSLAYPDGTILTKTFYYYLDERNPQTGKRIIETRLLIKAAGTWNIATYLWNEAQTEAELLIDGLDTQVSWITEDGINQSTLYHVPTENECKTCHQSADQLTPIGPSLRNLNREVMRNGSSLNQLAHLQDLGLLAALDINQVPSIVDYANEQVPLAERGRAYLDLNCAHCHNPLAWETPAERDFDFRYETPLAQSGIPFSEDQIIEALVDREMPFIGTTMLDQEGVNLIIQYIESL